MRAFSIFEAKSIQDGKRVVQGIASTPRPDRVGDVVDPYGMVKNGPVNFFLYHNHNMPVGNVEFGKPSSKGIPFEVSIPDVQEEGDVKRRVQEAWHSIKYKLLQAVSIGFVAVNGEVELTKEGGLHFKKWEILELSLVGVPANPEALIQSFKSFNPSEIRKQFGLDLVDSNERRELVAAATRGAVPLRKNLISKPDLNGAVRLIRS